MSLVHQILQLVFGILLAPAGWFGSTGLGDTAGLVVISAVTGVVLLIGFRATSRPKAIRAAKRKVQAHLLAVRIFRDDLGVVLRAQARLFPALGRYIGNMVVPFLVLLVPFAILFGHLDARYATRALQPGETVIVTAAGDVEGWSLEASEGITVETRGVHLRKRREVAWRIRAHTPGLHDLVLVSGDQRVAKSVRVGGSTAAPRRMRASLDSIVFAPSEPPIPAVSGVEWIEISLPSRGYSRYDLHWVVVFLIVSAGVAFGLRKRFGVEF